jgi:hypothetical protein
MLNIHGQRWPREIANKNSRLVAAQEIGISEHFEMQLGFGNVARGPQFVDYLYDFGPVDDLWNGTWGFIRAYNGRTAMDPKGLTPAALADRSPHTLKPGDPLYRPIGDRLKPIDDKSPGKLDLAPEQDLYDGTCPIPEHFKEMVAEGKTTAVTFYIDAVNIRDWLGAALPYDRSAGIIDPDPLAFILLDRLSPGIKPPWYKADASMQQLEQIKEKYLNDRREKVKEQYQARLKDQNIKDPIEPLVLRANAGDCIKIVLTNQLSATLADAPGDAQMPRIVPLNVDQEAKEGPSGAEDVRPSSYVTLHPQLVSYNVSSYNGAAVGYNGESPLAPGATATFYWYAGLVKVEGNRHKHESNELGPINLTSWGDIINQPPHGLIGALIIEPMGATYHDPATGNAVPNGGISAVIRYPDKDGIHPFREHVVMYRDGLNLHVGKSDGSSSVPIKDCRICDDSYDLGDKAFNHHTAAFHTRLGQEDNANLNEAFYPANFFTPQYKAIPTTEYTANPGEEVRFHVLQPHGRNRQHAFLLYGHDFDDILPYYGSRHSPLISVGKAMTVTIPSAHEGYWLYRDGPNHMWSGGLWGSFQVGTPASSP